MQEKLPEITTDKDDKKMQDDVHFIKEVKKEYHFPLITAGIIVFIVLFFNVISDIVSPTGYGINSFAPGTGIIDHRIAADDICVKDVYEMKNGDIYFSVESDAEFTNLFGPTIVNRDYRFSDNWNEGIQEFTFYTSIKDKLFNVLAMQKVSFVLPLTEVQYFQSETDPYEQQFVRKSNGIYYIGKHDEKITIWEKGQKLPAAPAQIEKRVEEERKNISADMGERFYDGALTFFEDFDEEMSSENED